MLLLLGCERTTGWTEEHKAINEIIGNSNALNCGHLSVTEDKDRANTCALNAIRDKKPFFVAYDVQGLDSKLIVALASQNGVDVYAIKNDSEGWDRNSLRPGSKLVGKTITVPCGTDVHIGPRGYLECY